MKIESEEIIIDTFDDSIYNKSSNDEEKIFEENIGIAYELFHRYKNDTRMEEDDFLQECFFFLWKAIKSYNPEKGMLSTLAFKIAHNHLYKERLDNDDALLNQAVVQDEDINEFLIEVPFQENYLEEDLIIECEREIERKLGPKYREAIQYNKLKFQGYSCSQIKEMYKYSNRDLEKIRYRIRELRKLSSDFIL